MFCVSIFVKMKHCFYSITVRYIPLATSSVIQYTVFTQFVLFCQRPPPQALSHDSSSPIKRSSPLTRFDTISQIKRSQAVTWPHTKSPWSHTSNWKQKTLAEATACISESNEAEHPWPHIQSMFTLQTMKKNSYVMLWHVNISAYEKEVSQRCLYYH